MIRVFDIIPKRVLISRETVRQPAPAVAAARSEDDSTIIDFDGVEAVAPSVIDELLLLLEQEGLSDEVRIVRMPAEPSSKYFAVARAHGLLLVIEADEWKLTRSGDPQRLEAG